MSRQPETPLARFPLFGGTAAAADLRPTFRGNGPSAIERSPLSLRDALAGLFLFVMALAGYGVLTVRLAQGQYFEYLNLAFDFDPYLIFSLLTQSPGETLGFKHPLLLLLRPVGMALMACGLSAKVAAGMTMAIIGAGTVTLVWGFLRLAGIRRPEAFLLSLMFGFSSSQILTSIIPESYGVSAFAIVLLWCVTAARLNFPDRGFSGSRYFSALLLVGATITNVVQAIIAELTVRVPRSGVAQAVRQTIRFGIVLSVIFSVLCVMVWHTELLKALQDPVDAAKQIWWLQTKGERSGALSVIQSFLAFSFVAPTFTYVTLPESTNMADFREWSFAGVGAITVVVWLALAAWGAVCFLSNRRLRPLAIGLLVALAFNLLFHLRFQYRGSIFLYAAHAHFVFFALSAGAALFARDRRGLRTTYLTIIACLTVLFAVNNVPMATKFVAAFDKPDTTCPAPCQ